MDYLNLNIKITSIVIITFISIVSCSKKTKVQFKGERALTEQQRTIERKIGSTGVIQSENGGFVNNTTNNGFQVHSYFGNNIKGKQGTTTNNYKVEYNVQMQMVQ